MRKKKILVLAAMLAVSLSACAGKNQAQQTTQAQSQETSQPQEAESAAAAVEAAKITSMEELTFPVGEKVSGAFTGTAYLIYGGSDVQFPVGRRLSGCDRCQDTGLLCNRGVR